jgi:hypothetical protein
MKKAKQDFCFPFYFQRYLSGTMGFTPEMHGAYLLAMIYQFQNGHFSEADINRVIEGKFEIIKHKYETDENGLYFNETMEEVIVDRKKFIETKRNNRLGKTKDKLQLNGSSSTDALQGSGDGSGDIVISKDYNIEELKDYLHAELPELGLDAPLVSSMQFDLIDSFISECEVFQKLANWKIYVERIKESDWLMRRSTGKGQKKTKMGLKWLCKPDTVRDVMAGNHDNVDTVSDGREWL